MKRTVIILIAILAIGDTAISQIINIPVDQPTIQAGIDSASAGDTILVAEGTYLENINFHGKAITLASYFLMDGDTSHISKTIIDGSNPEHPDSASTVNMLQVRDTTSVLCGFTITGGSGTGEFETLFKGVYTRNGGGIFSAGGKIVNNIIQDNHVTNNQVAAGGGLSAGVRILIPTDTGINLVIRDNILYQNSCSTQVHYALGGGMSLDLTNGITLVENNQIHHNNTFCGDPYKAMSGGMAAGKSTSNTGKGIIRNNLIHHNEAHSQVSFGGGIFYILFSDYISEEFTPTHFYNNIIHSNYSENYGGGISLWYLRYSDFPPPVDPVIYNNTIVGNSSKKGTGISIIDSEVVMFNNILWNNPTNETREEVFTDVFNYCPGYSPQWCHDQNMAKLHSKFNLVKGGYPGEMNFSISPVFRDSTWHLADNSASIGRGMDSVFAAGTWYTTHGTDCEGNKRPSQADPFIDVGAYESDREQVLLPIANLTDIYMYDHTLNPVFDPEIYSYEMGVVDTTFNSMNLKLLSADNLAYMEIQHAQDISSTDVAERTAFIKVTSSDSTIWEEYAVEFYYLSADATLSNLLVAGYDLQPLFHPDTLWYLVLLPPGTTEVPEIIYETSHKAAEVTYYAPFNILSIVDWRRTANINVDAEDGFRQRIYKIQFDMTTGLDRVLDVTSAIKIFPNPVESEIFIHLENMDPVSVTVLSITGEELFTRPMKGPWTNLDLSSFDSGVYFITIRSKEFVTTRKIIKL